MTGLPLVQCQNLARTYGTGRSAVVALHGISCAVQPSMRVAITGPSGSGKSTLLHLMAGLDVPTAGDVTWPAIGQRSDLRPGPVAVVFQGPSLVPSLNVIENVALPLALEGRGDDRAAAAAHAALERLGLNALAPKLPEELSGGQAQRVAVARALAGSPTVIFADEPTGQLDHTTAGKIIDALVGTAAHLQAALVIATHDPAVSERMDSHWSMLDGRLLGTEPSTPATLDPAWSA